MLKGYPRLSETFIAQEILGLERAGMAMHLYSLRHPTDDARHPVHDEITAPVTYLPEYVRDDRRRVWRAWRRVRRLPGYRGALRAWRRDLRRDRSRNRARRFAQALVLAAEMPDNIRHIYAHFLHTPSSVARYAAMIRGLPWSCSAHAKDIYTSADWDLAEKLACADWAVTCTRANAEHLARLADDPGKVHLVYHGLELAGLPPGPQRRPPRTGAEPGDPVQILSVGRLVEKKGYDVLLRALASLPPDLHWRFTHIGRWDLKAALAGQAHDLGIADRIEWRGAQARNAVFDAYGAADMFVLASRVAADGDRDGLPNVLMEAMSQRLACIATDVSGIPEILTDGETGLLVPPADPGALAAAMVRAARDPALRTALGAAGEARVRRDFDFLRGRDRLLGLFEATRPPDRTPDRTPDRAVA